MWILLGVAVGVALVGIPTAIAIVKVLALRRAPPPPPPPVGTGTPPPGGTTTPPPTPTPVPAPVKKAEPVKDLTGGEILWMFMIGGLLALGIVILRFKEILGFENVSLPIETEIGVLFGIAIVLIGLATPKKWKTFKVGVLIVGILILAVCAGFSNASLAQVEKSFHTSSGSSGANYTPRTLDGDPVVFAELVNGASYTAKDNQWTLWTKTLDMCPALLDPLGIEIIDTDTEYLFRSYSGDRATTGYNLHEGEHVPGHPRSKC